jgi:multidrug resistance efflux pump
MWCCFSAVIIGFWVLAGSVCAEGTDSTKSQSGNKPYAEAFQGKLVCSLKRNVFMYLKGTVDQLRVQVGQRVKQGDVLATYRMSNDNLVALKRRIAGLPIRDWELALSDVEKNLAVLYAKQRELEQLADHKLAPSQGIQQVEREVQAAEKQRTTIQEKLRIEKDLFQDDLVVLREQMGGSLKAVQTREPVAVSSPVTGHLLWINPEFRTGAELPPGTHAFIIGVMEPMLMRAQVHEMDAVKIEVGDLADVSFESFPGKVFEAKVSRLSWAPMTPALEQPSYYELELTVSNKELVLREGMKGEATLRKGSAP